MRKREIGEKRVIVGKKEIGEKREIGEKNKQEKKEKQEKERNRRTEKQEEKKNKRKKDNRRTEKQEGKKEKYGTFRICCFIVQFITVKSYVQYSVASRVATWMKKKQDKQRNWGNKRYRDQNRYSVNHILKVTFNIIVIQSYKQKEKPETTDN